MAENWYCLVLLVVAVSGTRSNAELLVDKPLVKIIGPYKPVAQSPQSGPCSNFNHIQTSFSRIERSLSSQDLREK